MDVRFLFSQRDIRHGEQGGRGEAERLHVLEMLMPHQPTAYLVLPEDMGLEENQPFGMFFSKVPEITQQLHKVSWPRRKDAVPGTEYQYQLRDFRVVCSEVLFSIGRLHWWTEKSS